jgi:flagellar basal body rod protein FlgC
MDMEYPASDVISDALANVALKRHQQGQSPYEKKLIAY